MDLRRGTASDLPFIYRLEKRYIEEIESDQLIGWQESIERHLDQWVASLPRTTVAESRGVRVGYLFWERACEKAVLASVNVDPAHRRRGIATILLKTFEDEARMAGCSMAELGFVSTNPVRHLYETLGYHSTGVAGRYVMMSKPL